MKSDPPNKPLLRAQRLPCWQRLAEQLRGRQVVFRRLDAPQLLKRALGLPVRGRPSAAGLVSHPEARTTG